MTTAPTPACAQGTTEPTENQWDWTAAPISPEYPSQEPGTQNPCPQPDESTLLYENQALCFLYPALESYQLTADVFGVRVTGPPGDEGPEPVVPFLEITTLPEPAGGRDVGAVALEWISANDLGGLPLELEELKLDGRPAVRITGEPGISESQRTLVVASDRVYSILVFPTDIELVRPSIDLMFATLADSLRLK